MYDILVIGGGINGVGIARDAAGRGLKVLLCEKGDLASATSSASSKLIHGGLRYLENFEFRLVREALGEREVLLAMAPHIVSPLRFVLPVDKGMRPAWMLRVGLFLYDYLAPRSILPPTRALDLRSAFQGKSLKPSLSRAFEYSDCWVDDARLVVLNAVDARERGANIRTQTQCVGLERHPGHWLATLQTAHGEPEVVVAKAVINAAGPWVDEVLSLFQPGQDHLRLVKGSHIVTRRLYDGEHAYVFQSPDKRIIFAIPYETDFTLIGTTDVDWSMDAGNVQISAAEIDYLCEIASHEFQKPVMPAEVVWSYAGVRPLYDDHRSSASVVTRDYVFDLNTGTGREAPALSIFGGKLTTYRRLAEHALEKLGAFFPGAASAWTEQSRLPGGDFPMTGRGQLQADMMLRYPWVRMPLLSRLVRSYGTRLNRILGEATCLEDLGISFGASLYTAEVDYLREVEFARTADDILWRRSKLGLRMQTADVQRLASYLLKVDK